MTMHKRIGGIAVAGVALVGLLLAPASGWAGKARPHFAADSDVDQFKKDMKGAADDMKTVPGTVKKEGTQGHKDMKRSLGDAEKDMRGAVPKGKKKSKAKQHDKKVQDKKA